MSKPLTPDQMTFLAEMLDGMLNRDQKNLSYAFTLVVVPFAKIGDEPFETEASFITNADRADAEQMLRDMLNNTPPEVTQ